jgi:adenosylhomocysteine nucleosidase
MIAILVAVKQELNPILRRAQASHIVRQAHLDFYEGTLGDKPVALLALGVGKECARIAAEMTIRCYRPDLIISAGFGGGLTGAVQQGDLIVGTEILALHADVGSEVRWRTAHQVGHLFGLEAMAHEEYRVHFGKLITCEEMVLQAAAKQRIGTATGALSVDMETSAVAAVCAARGTDFLGIRCITDNDHENLPQEFNDFFVVGQLQPGRIVTSCVRRPRLLLDLARLGYRAQHSGIRLARFLERALRGLELPALTKRQRSASDFPTATTSKLQ